MTVTAARRTGGAWRCLLCGFVHPGGEAPDSCPVCGACKEEFEPYAAGTPDIGRDRPRWRCLNCNFVHEGDAPPDECPLCGVPRDQFEAVREQARAHGTARALRTVIIGSGIAGLSAAETVREFSPEAPITLIANDPEWPYYRLNLTRYLAGEIERDSLALRPETWFADQRIDLLRNREAIRLLLGESAVLLSDGSHLPYDTLILATGGHPFLPPLEGHTLDGVFTLRTTADADEILRRVRLGARCAVVGGGILGIEAAGALARQGADVTLLESHGWLMPRQLSATAAAVLERHIASVGVRTLRNARTARLAGEGRVERVELQDGTALAADLVLFATGVRPNTALARRAGLTVAQGVVVDAHLSVGRPGIHAAGEVAECNGQTYGSWAASQAQGRIAAMNAVGIPTEFGGMPRSNTLKALGLDITSIGRFAPADGGDLVVEDGDETHHRTFLFRDGRILGAIVVGHPALAAPAKRAIETARDFSFLLHAGAPTCAAVAERLLESAP